MTKKNIKTLASLVAKNTQKDALYTFLAEGYEFTADEARLAGVADPRRVINQLRTEHGVPVYLNDRTLRSGEIVRRYRLGTPRRNG